MNKPLQIALIGNPNCGKTTIFNNLTGSRQKVGNWPGVTVEKKSGEYNYKNTNICITDLPGIYSLSPAPQNNAIDQKITNDFITNNQSDLYINVLDATNLKRNLYLSLQLISLNIPCIVVLNMIDKLKLHKLNIDYTKLSQILNCPVIAVSSTQNSKDYTNQLKDIIHEQIKHINNTKLVNKLSITNNLGLNIDCDSIKDFDALNNIVLKLLMLSKHNLNSNTKLNNYGYILQLLEVETTFLDAEINHEFNNAKQEITKVYQEDPDIIIADLRYRLINAIYQKVINKDQQKNLTNKQSLKSEFNLDSIVLNKYLGIPIFLFVLYTIFELSISLGEVLKPCFEAPSQFISENIIIALSNLFGLSYNLSTCLSQGIATGVTTVAGFIPQIGLMFVLLTFLEDSGYMARAAFVMDRLMQAAGLPGKSFVPLIISFGCNVPAILSTRTLDSPRDRILTCLMSPFMSCSARLAIFIVFASAFFPKHQGLMVFLLYVTGILIAILTGLILKSTILQEKNAPFILELPSYNIPTLKNITIATWQRCKGFIIRAGKLIIPICLGLQFFNSIQLNGHWVNNNLEESALSQAGKAITPILNPIGITNDNWPATVGLITGSLAKEIVVGTLNTLYSNNNIANNHDDIASNTAIIETTIEQTTFITSLSAFNQVLHNAYTESYERLKNLISLEHYQIANKEIDNSEFSTQAFNKLSNAFPSIWSAFAYCLFVLLYMPCLSTFSILIKEIGKNWAIASLVWSMDIAYITATTVYQISQIQVTPIKSLSIITAIVISHFIIFKFLKSGKLNNYFNTNNYNGHTSTA
jgi:ferrous iron transport protein B